MRINSNWIHILKVYFSLLHYFRTEYQCSSQCCINMIPYFVFFTYLTNFLDRINITLDCCSHCCIYQHTNIVLLHLFLNRLFQLLRNHSTTSVSFYVNNILLANTTKNSSFFHWIMRSLWGKYFERLSSITFSFTIGLDCISWSCYRHKISKWSTGCKYPINTFPFQKIFEKIIYLIFHDSKAWCKLISVHRSIYCRWDHGTKNRKLIKTAKKCIMVMRMVRFSLLI